MQEALDAAPQSWTLSLLPKTLGALPGYAVALRGISQWEDFFATLPRSLRRNLRRDFKRLSALGRIEIGWSATVEDANAVLTWLFAHKRQWSQSHGFNTQYLKDDRLKDFFIALADRTDLSTVPLVSFVKVDGVPVAAAVSLVSKSCVEGFFTTYDEAFRLYSVGTLLVEFLVKWAHANKLDFDFRPLDGDYKAIWANQKSSHKTRIIFLSARGRLAEFSLFGALASRGWTKLRKIPASIFERARARVA
ncbi:MAG: GNAT family N-acetyltransferase [Methylocella sp.]